MQNRSYLLGPIGILAIAACSPSTPEGAASEVAQPSMTDMPEMAQAPAPGAAQGPIVGVGVVTGVDPEAGTITLDHEPIDALSWPRMTMRFSAEPSILNDLATGDTVEFEIKSLDASQTIVEIVKR